MRKQIGGHANRLGIRVVSQIGIDRQRSRQSSTAHPVIEQGLHESCLAHSRQTDQSHDLAGLTQFVSQFIDRIGNRPRWLLHPMPQMQPERTVEQILCVDTFNPTAPRTKGLPARQRPADLLPDPSNDSRMLADCGGQARPVVEVKVKMIRALHI